MTTVSRPLYAICLANMRGSIRRLVAVFSRFSPSPDLAAGEEVGEGDNGDEVTHLAFFTSSFSFLSSFLPPLNDDDERARNRPISSAETTRFPRISAVFEIFVRTRWNFNFYSMLISRLSKIILLSRGMIIILLPRYSLHLFLRKRVIKWGEGEGIRVKWRGNANVSSAPRMDEIVWKGWTVELLQKGKRSWELYPIVVNRWTSSRQSRISAQISCRR